MNERVLCILSEDQSTILQHRLPPPSNDGVIVVWEIMCTVGAGVEDTDPNKHVKKGLEVIRDLMQNVHILFSRYSLSQNG
jgi:hypothetical protein